MSLFLALFDNDKDNNFYTDSYYKTIPIKILDISYFTKRGISTLRPSPKTKYLKIMTNSFINLDLQNQTELRYLDISYEHSKINIKQSLTHFNKLRTLIVKDEFFKTEINNYPLSLENIVIKFGNIENILKITNLPILLKKIYLVRLINNKLMNDEFNIYGHIEKLKNLKIPFGCQVFFHNIRIILI